MGASEIEELSDRELIALARLSADDAPGYALKGALHDWLYALADRLEIQTNNS